MIIYYYLGIALFFLGLIGALIKKDLVSILVCVELMLSSVNLLFVLFSNTTGNIDGEVQVVFTIIIAAVEAAVGLSLIISLFHKNRSVYTEDIVIASE